MGHDAETARQHVRILTIGGALVAKEQVAALANIPSSQPDNAIGPETRGNETALGIAL